MTFRLIFITAAVIVCGGCLTIYDFTDAEMTSTEGIDGFTVSFLQNEGDKRMMKVGGLVLTHSALSIKKTKVSVDGNQLHIKMVMTLSRDRYPRNDFEIVFEVQDGVDVVTFGKNREVIWTRDAGHVTNLE